MKLKPNVYFFARSNPIPAVILSLSPSLPFVLTLTNSLPATLHFKQTQKEQFPAKNPFKTILSKLFRTLAECVVCFFFFLSLMV